MEFAGAPSIVTKLARYDNLIVIRTLSRPSAWPAAASAAAWPRRKSSTLWADETRHNLNILSQNAALAAMDYADEILAHNIATWQRAGISWTP